MMIHAAACTFVKSSSFGQISAEVCWGHYLTVGLALSQMQETYTYKEVTDLVHAHSNPMLALSKDGAV